MDQAQLAKLMQKFAARELGNGSIRTCPARLSYPNLFEKSKPRGKITRQKYSATLLFPKGANLSVLYEAAKHTAVEGFGSKASSMGLQFPFNDQGKKAHVSGYEAGGVYIACYSDRKPGVIGLNGKPILDADEVYPGCWVVAEINPYVYKDAPANGVTFGLQNILKVADDEPFGGANSDPQEAFGDVLDASGDTDALFGGSSNGAGKTGNDPDAWNF